MDPQVFMLALLSMTDAEYQLWKSGIPYTQLVSDELDYEVFNDTCLMPSFTPVAGPASGSPINPPRLLWLVFVYNLDGFVCERPVGRNINVMGYPFPKGTRVPTVQEHEELVWLVGNLKLKMMEYSQQIYNPKGFADLGDDDSGDGGGDSKAIPSYQPRKRHFQ